MYLSYHCGIEIGLLQQFIFDFESIYRIIVELKFIQYFIFKFLFLVFIVSLWN